MVLVYHVSAQRIYTCGGRVLLCGVCSEGVEYTHLLQVLKWLLVVRVSPAVVTV